MRSATKKKTGKDPKYRVWIRSLPCLICFIESWKRNAYWTIWPTAIPAMQRGLGRTEHAHVGDRGLSQKCDDRESLPLCRWHHTQGPESAHRAGKRFYEIWGIEKEATVKAFQAQYGLKMRPGPMLEEF